MIHVYSVTVQLSQCFELVRWALPLLQMLSQLPRELLANAMQSCAIVRNHVRSSCKRA